MGIPWMCDGDLMEGLDLQCHDKPLPGWLRTAHSRFMEL